MYYVYLWTNSLNGKQYVGKGQGRRDVEHLKPSRSGLLAKAIRKHGLLNFTLERLVEGLGDEEAYAFEIETVTRLGTLAPNGYNLTAGGEGLRAPSDSTRAKLAALRRALPGSRRGAKNSPEHNARISAAHKGKKVDPEHLAKLQAGARAAPRRVGHRNPRSPESIEKQREAMLEHWRKKRAQ